VTLEERKKALELNETQGKKIKEYAKTSGKLEIYTLNTDEKAVMQKALEPVHKANPDIIPVRWIDEIYKMK
jgi:hypothetical protein